MDFDTAMEWSEPFCHSVDCYFCLSARSGFGKHLKWEYAKVDSVKFPLPHSSDVPYPECPGSAPKIEGSSEEMLGSSGSQFETSLTQRILSQAELNDWIRDFGFSKGKAELFASRMKERGFVAPDVKTSIYRNRHLQYGKFYAKVDDICFCSNILGLFEELNEVYNPGEWRLFIDSNKESLKAVLLHNGNQKPSLPVAYASHSKETYETMKTLLDHIEYDKHRWKICADLKVVAILCGLQGGYTKYCCFLCKWDSRADHLHYIKKDWPLRTNIIVGADNIQRTALVDKNNIILPPLHIKLGLAKNFIKKLAKDGTQEAFARLKAIFSYLSHAKLKEGVLNGPEIRKLLQDDEFSSLLSPVEAAAWSSFKLVIHNFLGNHKSPDYKQIVNNLLKNYKKAEVHMSLKIHFLDSHLDFFPENLGDVSDEHGERFHQQLKDIENRYSGLFDTAMMGDYVWSLVRENDGSKYKRQSGSKNFFQIV